MLVRAIAVATERSNAIGTLELECTPHGLVVVYLGVGAFAEGYAPAALASGTTQTLPWDAVRRARAEGDQLYLELDETLTPHSRLTLKNFSTGELPHPRELYKQRMTIRLASGGGALIASLLAAATVPHLAPRAGAAAAIGTAILVATALVLVGYVADRWVASGGVDGDAAREAFVLQLGAYVPGLVHARHAPRPPPKPIKLPTFQGLVPRTTAAVVITLTSTVLAAVLMAQFILREDHQPDRRIAEALPEEPREPTGNLRAAPPAPKPEQKLAEPPAPTPKKAPPPANVGDACSCTRADSVLWREPIPRLSTLVLSKKIIRRPTRDRLELMIAAVNNGDKPISELSLMVHFFEKDPPPSNKLYPVASRALYFAGPLEPGQAIKWDAEARGSYFEIDNPVEGTVSPSGEDSAPLNLLAELLHANHRPVRLHGAMMLAYLGDKRAREAALELREALRQDEAPYLRRLLAALGPIRACDVRVGKQGAARRVSACVFNASGEPKENLALRAKALEHAVSHEDPVAPPPVALTEATWPVPGQLAAGSGVRVSGQLELGDGAEQAVIEVLADRVDLLP